MPKVSVILTSRNHGRFIAVAIDSVLQQSFTDFELIIWDDASDDDSWAIISSYSDSRIRAFRNEQPLRAIAGVNRAISEIARGKYVAIHHSDDVWEPDKLRRQVAFLDRHPRIGAVFSAACAIDENGAPLADESHFYNEVFRQENRSRFEWLNHFFYRGNALCHPSVLIRKQCYKDVGLYRYGFAQVGDCDMWIRLCFKHEIHVLPQPLVRFRVLSGELNTSGSRPETRVRWITESYELLRNYLRLRSYRDMIAVFPEVKQYYRKGGFEARFVLAMIALGDHPFHFTKLFGMELLFDLIGNPAKAARIKSLYGFDYRNLIELSAKHDVFSHEYAAGLAQSIADRDAKLAQLSEALVRREAEARELQSAVSERCAEVAIGSKAIADAETVQSSPTALITVLEADVNHMHKAVVERDLRIAERDASIGERDERVSALIGTVSERDAQLKSLQDLILARDRSIDELHVSLAAKEADLHEVRAALLQLSGKLGELERGIAERSRVVESLTGTAADRAAQLAGIQDAIAAGQMRLAELEASVAGRDAEIGALQDEARGREVEVVRLEAEIDMLGSEVTKGQAELRAMGDSLVERESQILELRQKLAARDADVCHMHEAVATRDWRISELSATLVSSNDRIAQMGASIEHLQWSVKGLRDQLSAAENTIFARAGRAIRGGSGNAIAYLKARRWIGRLADCPLIDRSWYLATYPDIANKNRDPVWHYLSDGWKEGRQPGPDFDGTYYLKRYPEAAASGVPPLVHYWLVGRGNGYHINQATEELHKKHVRWYRLVRRCPFFDGEWYLRKYPDVAATGLIPAWHYAVHGWRDDKQPSPEFDVHYYRQRYPDLAQYGEPLLLHYWRRGRFEGRRPNGSLDFELIQANAKVPGISPEVELTLDLPPLLSREAPFISVIIPTYNRLARLPGILDSWRKVDESTRFPYEIIFSDDGSSDGSVEYLESVRDLPVRVLRNEHGGPSRARNSAMRAAAGERLLIIGDDIYPDPEILNAHAALAQRLGRMVATLGVVHWHGDLHVNHLMHHITEIGYEQFSYSLFANDAFTDFRHFYTCNVCIDRGLLFEEGVMFDETFDRAAFEDVELAYRLSLRGLKLFYSTRARGDHYHPYQADGFCRRQEGAGEMAAVFAGLHPAVGGVIGVPALVRRARQGRGTPVSDATWQQRIDAVIERCRQYEAFVAAIPGDFSYAVRSRLSAIYVRLFRAMYEYGVLQRRTKCPNPLAVAMSGHFDASWEPYWTAIGSQGDSLAEWPASELLDVAMSLGSGVDVRDFFSARQAVLFDELQRVPPLEFSAVPPRNKDEVRFEAAFPALVVESGDAARAEAIARFRSVFRSKGRVFERSPEGLLARIRDDGTRAEPVAASELEVSAFHWPLSGDSMLPRDHLLSTYIALSETGLCLAIVSNSLAEGPLVVAGNLRDHLVFSREVADSILQSGGVPARFTGKVLRLVGEHESTQEKDLQSLLGVPIEWKGEGVFESRDLKPAQPVRYLSGYLPRHLKVRPVILVFPVFLAVGGVERNMVEIMRKLNHRFDFVIVTMERLRQEQGSLAAQAAVVATAVIEMPEFVSQRDFLRVLHRIRESYSPDLVWVCNGSPWFCDHASEIRSLFASAPIVDQEVYDTEQGWIARYSEPGIRSFDHFIAVNRKIERRFLDDFRIPREQVSLIYSAIDANRIREYKAAHVDKASLRERFGIPAGKRIFTFVGRLTSQKRPLLFLELARRRLLHDDECYVLVGDGELAREAMSFIEGNKLRNVVRIPYIANTLELHSVSQGIVFTSAFEGLPIAMLEALTMGVPAFSTDVGDVADILLEYGSGAVIPVNSTADEMEGVFEKWLKRRPEYERNARNAEDTVIDRFSSESIASQYADLWSGEMSRHVKAVA